MSSATIWQSAVAGESDVTGSRERIRWSLLVVGLLALLLLNLGNRGLNEPDEGRYSNIAGEMLEGEHGWWEPRMSDFAHYDKPPMVYWVTAIAFKTFGHSEWAARVPSLLGALMALAGIGWVAWRLYGSRTAWWTVLFCGTMGQFWVLARMLTPDMLLTGFSTLAIGFWAESRHRDASWRWWLGCGLLATLAWWTKATAALVPLLGLTVGLLVTKDRRGLRALRPLRLWLLIIAAGSPWYLSLMYRHPELEHFFFGRELAGRIVGHPDGRQGPIYYHVAFSLIGWLPWWPAAWARLFMKRKEIMAHFRQQHWPVVPMEAWVVIVGLAVFSMMSSKLVTYTLPFAPWAALFCARVLMRQPTPELEQRITRQAFATLAVCAAIFVGFSFALPHWESRLGAGSSMREVAKELRKHHATVAYVDRFTPGMEFYFGESVYYVTDHIPRQLATDTGYCEALGESHFVRISEFTTHLARHASNDVWLVRYKAKSDSPLMAALPQTSPSETLRVGEFAVNHVAKIRNH